MRASICGVLTLVAFAGLALPVSGQAAKSKTTTVTVSNAAPAARLPYTAEYKITRVRTLADGSTITQESTETVALDSQGRRMTSTTTVPVSGDQTPKTHVSVSDPVARTNSSWTVPGKKATVTAMPAPGAPRNCAAATPAAATPAAGVQHVKPTVEDLGTETIQGMEARGRKTTTTTPAGTIGNNQPLVRTNELWTATTPGLKGLVAREVSDDPQSGKMTKELTNFNQAEPDATVFQPPAGYEIVNKPAPGSECPGAEGTEQPMAPIPPPPPPPAQ
jgi:hypothetical protein